ncbi:DUF7133 domain-containing protein [Aureliella helgolandensis]|uniref:Cytochrome c n=1 Tax=Aureliella helgolandensis TaxID=2527968 RepID=A0A518GA61_9BACT|nr:c-type cytochrome [Aureliella helgolandensis]QDV25486.1 Cytochrome c [Aureliella helgolandensis]
MATIDLYIPFARSRKRHIAMLSLALGCIASCSLFAQSIPEERRITYREQSLTPYDPFPADEMWKRIEIPPAPALSPEEALKSFKVAPGFRLQCIASEPLVVDPVTFEFDPDGRIWAVEFRGWMLDIDGKGEGDPIGKVVVLEDTDGDTIMDKSTVFLDNLVMPRAISFVQGGVLVAEPPNLWYCQDTNGDLKCDRKTLVAQYGRPGNPEHTENGLMHALDNWMYSANATQRHKFTDGKLIEEPTRYRGQWGITQDDYGRLFYNYENSPLHGDLFPAEYLSRNNHLGLSEGLNVNIAAQDREVFPIRVTPGITLGANELRDDGTLRTFTIACGPSIYRGDQFPAEYYGSAVIPEAAGNLVRLAKITENGVHLTAQNAFGKRELLASTDERFRPVCSRTGPDGAIYVCDLYRGIIEHVIFMMPYLRNQILSRGLDKPLGRGRIYRIVHEGKPLGPPPKMSQQKSLELVEHLSHPNGWWRDTAQRLLVERQAVDAAGALRALAQNGASHLARIHALWTLEGIGRLDWETVSAALADKNQWVRMSAIRLSERFLDDHQAAATLARLKQTTFSDDPEGVRLQLLFTLGEAMQSAAADADGTLQDQVERQMAENVVAAPSALIRTAALSGLAGHELEFAARLMKHPGWTETMESQHQIIDTLAMATTDEGQPERVGRLLELAAGVDAKTPWQTDAIMAGVVTSRLSLSKWPVPIALAQRPALLDLLVGSSRPTRNKYGEQLQRIVTWRGDTNEHPQRPVLKPLTSEQEALYNLGDAVYKATCHACHKADGRGMAGQAPPLAESEWVSGDPQRLARIVLHGLHGPVKVGDQDWNMAMPGLGHSPIMNDERLAGVLTYVRRNWDNFGSPVTPDWVASIRQATRDRKTPWTVEELLAPQAAALETPAEEVDPLDRYRPVLDQGDAERGRELFHRNVKVRCNACHKIGDTGGGFVGPDLTVVGSRATTEHLLQSLVDPSAEIAKGFETLVVVTESGEIVSGTFVSEDEGQLVVAPVSGGSVAIDVDEIVERVASPISSMPPMGEAFTAEQIADLVAYLATLKSTGANRLNYLDDVDPYYVSHQFPKLTTPMWVDEEEVECVVILSIDDLRDTQQYERFLRPVLDRLKKIDGRAPLSIFTCSAKPGDPQLERWLSEGLSLEVHTMDHPCPLFGFGDLEKIRTTIDDCTDLIAKIPHNRPVAFRSPCCDVLNSNSPRLYSEILAKTTPEGNFLSMSSTVHHLFTKDDPSLPRDIVLDEGGRDRFLKFIKGNVKILGKTGYEYANYVTNYPYPYVVGRQIWEIPCHAPGDHQADFYAQHYGHRIVEEWKKGVDGAVVKQGLCTLLFHPYGKCTPEQIIEVIDYATSKYGRRIKFLTMRDVQERLNRTLLAGHPLRSAKGEDNGVRLLDVNHDGVLDVVIGNEQAQLTRLWSPETSSWREIDFPLRLVDNAARDAGVRFGILDDDGLPTAIVRNGRQAGAWRFDGERWVEQPQRLKGLDLDGQPVLTGEDGHDRGVRLRDIDGDGCCELLVGNDSQRAVFAWSTQMDRWEQLPYALPAGTTIVDAQGRDAGLRLADTNGDGRQDVIFSSDTHYSVHEFVSPQDGWAQMVVSGKDGDDRAIPPIVTSGENNGAFLHSGRLWVVNEQTNPLPNHAATIDLSQLNETAPPAKP